MAKEVIRIEGLDKVVYGLEVLPDRINWRMSDAIRKSAIMIERKTKPITPIDTGYLRSKTRAWVIKKDYAEISAKAPYAAAVHEGTRKWPLSKKPKSPGTVRRFLEKGAEASAPFIEKTFSDAVDRAIEDV